MANNFEVFDVGFPFFGRGSVCGIDGSATVGSLSFSGTHMVWTIGSRMLSSNVRDAAVHATVRFDSNSSSGSGSSSGSSGGGGVEDTIKDMVSSYLSEATGDGGGGDLQQYMVEDRFRYDSIADAVGSVAGYSARYASLPSPFCCAGKLTKTVELVAMWSRWRTASGSGR